MLPHKFSENYYCQLSAVVSIIVTSLGWTQDVLYTTSHRNSGPFLYQTKISSFSEERVEFLSCQARQREDEVEEEDVGIYQMNLRKNFTLLRNPNVQVLRIVIRKNSS